jgi:hypothetical protein
MNYTDTYQLIEKENLFGELAAASGFGRWNCVCKYGRDRLKVSSGYGYKGCLFTVIPLSASEEETRRKVQDLVKREIATQKKGVELQAAREEQDRKYEEQQQLLRKQWIEFIRVAFGGSPTEKLPEDKQPKALSNKRLLSVCHETSVKLPIPTDQPTKAAFFRDLDALFHKHGLTW